MSLITKVKAGSISSLSDARYFAGMGVDWLGFDVNPQSDSYVSAELYKNIAGWVAGPNRVIEFSAPISNETVQEIIADYAPDFIQVEWSQVSSLHTEKPLMVNASLDSLDTQQLAFVASRIQFLVLDCGASQPLDSRNELIKIAQHTKILLVAEPNWTDTRRMITELPIQGIALRGSKELKPGLKEYDYSSLLESLEDDS